MNDLVVTGQDAQMPIPNGVDTVGGSIVDSSNRLLDDVRNGEWDQLTTYADGAFFALDAIGIVADPLNGVIKAGVGWLFRHVAFLREPVEFLTGDPNFVRALSDTWENISTALSGAADDHQELLAKIQNWHGDAADAYRSLASSYSTGLNGLSGYAANLSGGLTTAAVAVGTTRMVVFEAIVSWITTVIKRAIVAATTSTFTFGGSLAAFLTSTIADAAMLLGRMAQKVRRLIDMLRQFTSRFSALRTKANQLDMALRRTQQSLGQFAGRRLASAGRPDLLVDGWKVARPGSKLEELQKTKDRIDKAGYRFPKEGAKQISREIDRQQQQDQDQQA